ncbi:GlxA family transcriptional regulator [uncultured Albimonas sp.]|uniref:GlxA family transcriptional regulator n=1 Tax=uncultured Albimonas sp. TaxID=1331701 RepID=UPI0030EC9420|tara:strand:+ start:953 stop:1912 length:960 start_codon:yes stop_codon:yes gene_type:complete
MRRISLFLKDGFQLMGLAALAPFEFANIQLGREVYRVAVVAEDGRPARSSLGPRVETEAMAEHPDTLLVIGEVRPKGLSPAARDWIARAGSESRRVAGVCTGAFALAEAGLLDGRAATTHWAHARRLQQMHPGIRVNEDRIFIADGPIWTSAGMTAGIDMTLALVEDDLGAEVARSVARRLVIYHRRPGGQSQFSTLLELEPRSDRIRRALIHAREHLKNPLTVDELAQAASLSPRQFSRLFREETGQSPAKAVERLRLETAWSLLEEGRLSMDEVAREAGFADRDRMRRAFLRAYGQPPQSLRRSLRLLNGDDDAEVA